MKENRLSVWYLFEESAAVHGDIIGIWSRTGEYTYREIHQQACRYAQKFLAMGVQPGELVAFYLQNSPEFIFAWLGLWAIGCAPTMINYNLGGDALVHCLKVAQAKLMLADEDEGCQARLNSEGMRDKIRDLGIEMRTVDDAFRADVNALEPRRPERKYRENIKGPFPIALFYTRYIPTPVRRSGMYA